MKIKCIVQIETPQQRNEGAHSASLLTGTPNISKVSPLYSTKSSLTGRYHTLPVGFAMPCRMISSRTDTINNTESLKTAARNKTGAIRGHAVRLSGSNQGFDKTDLTMFVLLNNQITSKGECGKACILG